LNEKRKVNLAATQLEGPWLQAGQPIFDLE